MSKLPEPLHDVLYLLILMVTHTLFALSAAALGFVIFYKIAKFLLTNS